MFFSRVKVKRSEICGGITDIATLEFNVRDEVVPESFLDQNKYKSQNLERIITRIKNLKPKYSKKLLKRLKNKPKTTDNTSNQKSGKIVTPETSLDNLIEYFLDNIMVEETHIKFRSPIQTNQSHSTFFPLKHASNVNASNIRSKYQVHLSPIKASKVKPCSLLKPLLSKPSKPVHTICHSSYGAGPPSRPLPLGSNIHSVASNLQQYL